MTEFFPMNCTNEIEKILLYKEFPEYFVQDKHSRTWVDRKEGGVIGLIEKKVSFNDLKFVNVV